MAESHTLLNIITACTELLVFNSHIVNHLWVHNTAEMVPHSWHWRLWSLVVSICQGWVIRLETSLMREARTEVGSSPFFLWFFLAYVWWFMLFSALKKKELFCSQYHLSCFWLCQSSFSCIWQDALTNCSPLHLSYPLSGNFCYLDDSYL